MFSMTVMFGKRLKNWKIKPTLLLLNNVRFSSVYADNFSPSMITLPRSGMSMPVINEVFDRLNRNSRKLERQEMRHAKYDGWFIKVAEREAEQEEWERLGVVTKGTNEENERRSADIRTPDSSPEEPYPRL